MRIEDIKVSETPGGTELSGREGDFRLWFRFSPEVNIIPNGDPFLATYLLPAMLRGENLEIDPAAPVSELLLRSTDELQSIFNCWNPAFQKITVRCRTQAQLARNQGIASFYSGGVDSNYTFLAHRQEITHLVSIRGFDFVVEGGGIWDPFLEPQAAFAREMGKEFVRVATNIRQLVYPFTRLGWDSLTGPTLAAIGLALGFPNIYVPSSHTYSELMPGGLHALTEPMWSTEATSIIHDGAGATRSEKVRAIAAEPRILSNLWVCWEQPGTNCGHCSKCTRTMIALHLLGVRSPLFPAPLTPRTVRRLNAVHSGDLAYFIDNMQLAEKTGDRETFLALRHCIRKFELARLARQLDQQLFGGMFRRGYVAAMRITGRPDPDRHASRLDLMG